ncbi:hypothetical protein SLNWT_3456 [Streptomyces albus]|uniref:Uncharacterized protein n=1 Tax=Streptomyces albus (strain ATCC 21838 / DSM 41398 / FERM P-419 / JCM 4703 / NBRC 107858) TaxID=1081613 RepID=A0A0B5F0K7_STRA4|nr:hypothetical protein SLNWT_3456 [Streptomyces albus]AOU78137.1 hypothetical protein SLNHY_3446 [Streptomyces albus]AYN33892.1 hypothetical protein DUI70_3391 [Streptomyces albus]
MGQFDRSSGLRRWQPRENGRIAAQRRPSPATRQGEMTGVVEGAGNALARERLDPGVRALPNEALKPINRAP